MNAITNINLHHTKSISVKWKQHDSTTWQTFIFTAKDGSEFEVNVFVTEPTTIEGAELIALMAAPELETA